MCIRDRALGGTGGLKIGADFLKKLNPNAKVLISDPSWENHRALFTNAGFTVETYAYYDADMDVPCGDCVACCTSSQFVLVEPTDEAVSYTHLDVYKRQASSSRRL